MKDTPKAPPSQAPSPQSPALKAQGASPRTQELYEKARQAREKSYSPYSGHKVGAAILTTDGHVFGGCNIENSSYGGTVCAERTAVWKAVSEDGAVRIAEVVVVTDATPPWPPCGFCRQIIAEFGTPATRIHSTNLAGESISLGLPDLLPHAFTPEHLGK